MQRQFFVTDNGQEVQTDDVNLLGEDSALADDRVFAELVRMLPFDGTTVTKGVFPYGFGPIVQPNGASGSVLVFPFRTFISSNTAVGTNSTDNWRDIRTALFVGTTTTLSVAQSFLSNSSGNPRWDLVYVRVDRDLNEAAVTRYVKTAGPPVTETPTSIVVVKNTITTLHVVTGTPSSTPALPSIPTDAGGSYYVPIAYVRIPNGFVSTNTILSTDIFEVAPIIRLSEPSSGVSTLRPANGLNLQTGPVVSGTLNTWASTGTRPSTFIPPSTIGEEKLVIALDLRSTMTANWSMADGSILDNTRDWRKRFFKFTSITQVLPSLTYPWQQGATSTNLVFNSSLTSFNSSGSPPVVTGFGQSFIDENSPNNQGNVMFLQSTNSNLGASTSIRVYVDLTNGNLKFTTDGTFPTAFLFLEISASGQYSNS